MGNARWTPVKRRLPNPTDGYTYCSPACGGGCLWTEHEDRWAEAKATKERLTKALGAGWKIRVSENLGWHCEVYRGGLHVYISKSRVGGGLTYWTLMGEPGEWSGKTDWTLHGQRHRTPEAAVRAQLRHAHAAIMKNASWFIAALGKSGRRGPALSAHLSGFLPAAGSEAPRG